MKTLEKIKKQLAKSLDSKRYDHTLGVAYTAAALAMCYEEDVKKSELAGLLHDCAKCMDNEKKLHICEKYNIDVREAEKRNPFLLHAKVGAHLARKKYDIEDEDILNAITYHTTGRPEMSLLEKIIYIADYIEPGREQTANLEFIRKLAFKNLDEALVRILEDTLKHLNESEKEIDPMTQKTYYYYNGGEINESY